MSRSDILFLCVLKEELWLSLSAASASTPSMYVVCYIMLYSMLLIILLLIRRKYLKCGNNGGNYV